MFSDLPNEDVVKVEEDVDQAQFMELLYAERYMTFKYPTTAGAVTASHYNQLVA